jgi:hypothetical protein
VAGVLGYLCWPYLDDPAKPPPSKANKAAELTADLLSPPAAADLSRNIFESAQAPGTSPAPTVRTSSPQSAESAAKKPDETTTTAPDSLVLSGTFVRGKNRVALINDALYAAGDPIPAAIVSAAGCRVKSVEVDRVLLDIDGRQAELVYRDLLASTAETLAGVSADGAAPATPRPASSTPSAPQPPNSKAK